MGISAPSELPVVVGPAPLAAGNWSASQELRSFKLFDFIGERLPLDLQSPKFTFTFRYFEDFFFALETSKWEQ